MCQSKWQKNITKYRTVGDFIKCTGPYWSYCGYGRGTQKRMSNQTKSKEINDLKSNNTKEINKLKTTVNDLKIKMAKVVNILNCRNLQVQIYGNVEK